MDDDYEDYGHRFCVVGGEVVDLDQKVRSQPPSIGSYSNTPAWLRNYAKKLEDEMIKNTSTNAEELLYKLHFYEQELTNLKFRQEELIDLATPKEVKDVIDGIKSEFSIYQEIASKNIEQLKADIRTEVLQLGKTVENDFYQVRWVKGRNGGFDTKMLEGMAKLIPQLNDARKPDGEPTVSFVTKK